MGHAEPFAFEDSYRPSPDVRRLVTGTPGILGLAGLECGVDLQLQADPKAVEAKGLALAELFIELVESRCANLGVALASPRNPHERGLHVSLSHPDAFALVQALIARGVFGDYREVARFGFSALYLSYAQVWDAVEILRDVLASRSFAEPQHQARAAVT
jgi:kynureninase